MVSSVEQKALCNSWTHLTATVWTMDLLKSKYELYAVALSMGLKNVCSLVTPQKTTFLVFFINLFQTTNFRIQFLHHLLQLLLGIQFHFFLYKFSIVLAPFNEKRPSCPVALQCHFWKKSSVLCVSLFLGFTDWLVHSYTSNNVILITML